MLLCKTFCTPQTFLIRKNPFKLSSHSFWWWLNVISNKVDESRISEVGPERAAAEWLIRNGAKIRWNNQLEWQTLYDFDEIIIKDNFIVAIDATDSSIMLEGFKHLENLKAVNQIILRRCSLVKNEAIAELKHVAHSLKHLQIISCGNITDKGVEYIGNLRHLEYLKIFDLYQVKDSSNCEKFLREKIPSCHIVWPKV